MDMQPPNPRKRTLLPLDPNTAPSLSPTKRTRIASTERGTTHRDAQEVGRLVTRSGGRGTQVLKIELDRPFYLGRSTSANDYVFPPEDKKASAKHARVYCITADTGEHFATLQDLHSTNGTLHNGRLIGKGGTVVLSEGDKIEIGSHVFRYHHTAPSPALSSTAFATATSTPASAFFAGGQNVQQVGDFLLSPRTLGSGAFSQVFLALSTKTLKQVACKRLHRSRVKADRLKAIEREVEMLKRASHPNINKIEDVVVGEEAVHIFLQLVPGGDLFSYLLKKTRIDAPEAKFILYQLLLALRYLHDEVGIAHRDIKLENVILASSGPFPKVQLADFGQSRPLSLGPSHSLNGTLQYMAPEQLLGVTRRRDGGGAEGKPANGSKDEGEVEGRGQGWNGMKGDMWSLGILLALLLTGAHPFEPWSSSASSSASSSRSSYTHSKAGLTALFGPTAAHELKLNPGDERVCKRIIAGLLKGGDGGAGGRGLDLGGLVGGRGFGSGDEAARTLISHLLDPSPSRRWTARQAFEDSDWIVESRKELKELYAKVVGKETA
ncbi:hypothetical protein JCM11251_007941 [Rhodosporidiobolus azoricus]